MAQPKLVSTTQFTIEKGIPLPQRGARTVYPFPDLEVGDSVRVPKSARSTAYAWAARHGRRFVCNPDGPDFARVWRIA